MFEKVNKHHPDKVADRIAGALVDYAYSVQERPTIAVEVLIGHNNCTIISESSVKIPKMTVENIVSRISNLKIDHDNSDGITLNYIEVPQDTYLASNQKEKIRCGDNGIFKGVPVTEEQKQLTKIAQSICDTYESDGKYVLADNKLIICQSTDFEHLLQEKYPDATINPLGDWTGGVNVDSGATNRKLGSDMGDGVTGGGLMGKDISKADVSVNIFCHLLAQEKQAEVTAFCAIGDETITFRWEDNEMTLPYEVVTDEAKKYIDSLGGFEKFAEWGLIR